MHNIADIKSRVKLSDYLASSPYHIEVKNGRCAAKWRGGERDSVAIDDDKGTWCDHGNGDEGGDLFKLVQIVEGVDFLPAVRLLRERFNIPDSQSKVTATYNYSDENGVVLYRVLRYEPGFNGEKKTFVQMKVDASGNVVKGKGCMNGVRRVPYHLPRLIEGVAKNIRIYIVEGEKDAENMEKLGLYATTNPGGAGKWHDEYSAFFKGATVVTVISDRDTAENDYRGQRHAEQVRESLERIAGVKASIVYVGNESCKDSSDWISKGATADDFNALADNPPSWFPPWQSQEATATADAGDGDGATQGEEPEAEEAAIRSKKEKAEQKRAIFAKHKREKVLTNYEEVPSGNNKPYFFARTAQDVVNDLFAQTLDEDNLSWPRLVGTVPFVIDKTKTDPKQRYEALPNPVALFGWIHRTVPPKWKSNGGAQDSQGFNFLTKAEFYSEICHQAKSYEGISIAPHYPPKSDQFYDIDELPKPSEGHRVFWELVDSFYMADETYRLLLAAFFLAPMFNGEHPLWIVSTVDAQGSGKSSVVEICALLYALFGEDEDKNDAVAPPMFDYTWPEIKKDPDRIKRQVVSTEGRGWRIFRIDNVTGTFTDSETLASWVTAPSFTGMRQYGSGVEERPNDLTWALTSNGATIDDDTASRAFTLKVRDYHKRPTPYVPRYKGFNGRPLDWKPDLKRYIGENQRQLHADMLDMLKNAPDRRSTRGRFTSFLNCVVSAVCKTDGEFEAVIDRIEADAVRANVNSLLTVELTDAVKGFLAEMPKIDSCFDPTVPTLISMTMLRAIVRNCSERLAKYKNANFHDLIKMGFADEFSAKFSALTDPRLGPSHGNPRPQCVVYGVQLIPSDALTTKYQLVDLVSDSPSLVRKASEAEILNVEAIR